MGEYLQETIDSVTSYPNNNDYELIIINDGSTDSQTIKLLQTLETKGFFVLNQVCRSILRTALTEMNIFLLIIDVCSILI